MKMYEKLYQYRKESGLTQEEVAGLINVSRQSISNWENGTAYPSIQKTKELLQVYGKSMQDLDLAKSTSQSLLEQWIGKVCEVSLLDEFYPQNCEVLEVEGSWVTLRIINKKSSHVEIYNIDKIDYIKEVVS